jgi:flagellar hook-length control protein FliK
MMSEAGIQLGNATVSAGMSDQNNGFGQAGAAQQGGGRGSRGGMAGDSGSDDGAPVAPAPRQRALGMVDTFA